MQDLNNNNFFWAIVFILGGFALIILWRSYPKPNDSYDEYKKLSCLYGGIFGIIMGLIIAFGVFLDQFPS